MVKKEEFTNILVSDLLRSVAAAYVLQNGNRFKIIAYEKAADSIEHLNREIYDLWQEKKLDLVPGLGTGLRASLNEYFETGASPHFNSILATIPKPVFQLMKVPSIGPKRAFKLVMALHLETSKSIFEDLKKAAERNMIAEIPSFGKKSQEEILAALARYKNAEKQEYRMPLPYAHRMAMEIMEYLKQNQAVKRVDALGSMRRMSATIGDIDIAVGIEGKEIGTIIEHFLNYPKKIAVDNSGESKASIILSPNIRVDLRVQATDNYGSMLQYFTGNKAHNIKLREYALKKGLSLSEYGIKNVDTGEILLFDKEEKYYNYIGFQYVPPELREGGTELQIALNNNIPDLVTIGDIKGDLHTHSSYDLKPSHDFGLHSYQELVAKAETLGYEYIGFSDHNPKITDHSKEDIVEIMKNRKSYIDSLFSKNSSPVNYFISLETDILPSGELALPKEALEYVDFLIVSVHSSFKMPKNEMTKRILKGLSNPKVKLLAHPTGRLINKRPGYEVEWSEIFEHVLHHNQALEINSWPERLDLPDSLVHEAIQQKVKFIIDTDAHAIEHMDNMRYGVAVARRGWATKSDIINAGTYKQFKNWISDNSK